jgi:hypothetical protein
MDGFFSLYVHVSKLFMLPSFPSNQTLRELAPPAPSSDLVICVRIHGH